MVNQLVNINWNINKINITIDKMEKESNIIGIMVLVFEK